MPYLSVAAALRAYVLRPASLDVLASLETTTSLTRTYSPYLINCRALLLTYFLYLNHPLYISLAKNIEEDGMPYRRLGY